MGPVGWSPKQQSVRDAVLDERVAIVVVPGPVQSGKTFAAVVNFHLWAMSRFNGEDFILGAKSSKQMTGAVLKYSEVFSQMVNGGWSRREDCWVMRSAFGGFNRFYPLLGGTRGTEERARSFSAQGALLDEATLLDFDFLNTVEDRCSKRGSKLVLVCNPAGPLHPVKVNYVDRADGSEIMHVPFELADNPTLSDRYVRRLKQRYRGAMFQRMVLGEWAGTSGLVYPHIGSAVGVPPSAGEVVRWTVGVDWAHSSSTHAVLCGQLADGTVWVFDEWEYAGRERGPLTDVEQSDRLADWVGLRNVSRWAVDPSAAAFRVAMRRRQRAPVVAADNDVLNGIQYVRAKTEDGQLRISRRCGRLIGQLHNYRWDERAGALGVDKPVKDDDHGPDALRYDRWTAARPRRKVRVR